MANSKSRKEPLTPAFLRKRAKLTQRQVGAVLGVRSTTVSEWERRVSYPKLTFAEILQLTLLYNCTIAEFAEAFDNINLEMAADINSRRLEALST